MLAKSDDGHARNETQWITILPVGTTGAWLGDWIWVLTLVTASLVMHALGLGLIGTVSAKCFGPFLLTLQAGSSSADHLPDSDRNQFLLCSPSCMASKRRLVAVVCLARCSAGFPTCRVLFPADDHDPRLRCCQHRSPLEADGAVGGSQRHAVVRFEHGISIDCPAARLAVCGVRGTQRLSVQTYRFVAVRKLESVVIRNSVPRLPANPDRCSSRCSTCRLSARRFPEGYLKRRVAPISGEHLV